MKKCFILRSEPSMPRDSADARSFVGNRFAAVSDFATDGWAREWQSMEEFSDHFTTMWSEYEINLYQRWTLDPLHTRFRCWEYPYVSSALRKWCPIDAAGSAHRTVLDLGTGVTFFPFYLVSAGYDVVASDIDPSYPNLYRSLGEKARKQGMVRRIPRCEVMDARELKLADESVDAVISVSVIEHLIEGVGMIVKEVNRVLKPGGLFILTCDVMYSGHESQVDRPLNVEGFNRLLNVLDNLFQCPEGERVRHPRDLLLWNTAPPELYRKSRNEELRPKPGLQNWIWPPRRFAKSILKVPRHLKTKLCTSPRVKEDMWAVYGGVYRKRCRTSNIS